MPAVRKLLALRPDWTQRKLADEVGVDHTTIGDVVAEIAALNAIEGNSLGGIHQELEKPKRGRGAGKGNVVAYAPSTARRELDGRERHPVPTPAPPLRAARTHEGLHRAEGHAG